MSTLSSIEDTIKEHFSSGGASPATVGVSIDVGKVLEIVTMIVQAAPAIEQGFVSAVPFVEALVAAISNGGLPTGEAWTELRARLDANSAVLAEAGAEAQSELAAGLPSGPDESPVTGEAPTGSVVTNSGSAVDLASEAKLDAPAGEKGK